MFAPRGGEGEEDPVRVPGGGGEAGVAAELAGEAFEALGAVVVLKEEREAGVRFGPDAVAVGTDDLTPLSGAAPLRPPLVEPAAGPGAGRAKQDGEEAVEADEMCEALAGGEVVDEAAAPGEIGHVDSALCGDEGGTERTEDPVEWGGVPPRLGSEAIEDVEGVQLGEPHAGSALTGEADVGHLRGSEHPMVIEQTAEQTVTFGETTDDSEQPSIDIPPATTTSHHASGAYWRCSSS
jgi:hypothetical protein